MIWGYHYFWKHPYGWVVSAYFQVRLCLLVSGKVGYIKLSQRHGLNSPVFQLSFFLWENEMWTQKLTQRNTSGSWMLFFSWFVCFKKSVTHFLVFNDFEQPCLFGQTPRVIEFNNGITLPPSCFKDFFVGHERYKLLCFRVRGMCIYSAMFFSQNEYLNIQSLI